MNLPSGLIFYLDFQYGTAQNFKSANESLYGAAGSGVETIKRTDGNFDKGLYGAGEFAYSITESAVFNLRDDAGATVGSASAAFNGILGFDSEFSASKAGEFGALTGAKGVVKVVKIHKSF